MSARWPTNTPNTRLDQDVRHIQDAGHLQPHGLPWYRQLPTGDVSVGWNPGYDRLAAEGLPLPGDVRILPGIGGYVYQARESRFTVAKHFGVVEIDDPCDIFAAAAWGADLTLASVSGTPGDANDNITIGWQPVTLVFSGGELGDNALTSAVPPANIQPGGGRLEDYAHNKGGFVNWGSLPVGADPQSPYVAAGTVDQRVFGSPNHSLQNVTSQYCTILGFGLAGATEPDPSLTSVVLGTATTYVVFFTGLSGVRVKNVTAVAPRGGLFKDQSLTVLRCSAVVGEDGVTAMGNDEFFGAFTAMHTESGNVTLNVGDKLYTRVYVQIWNGVSADRGRLVMQLNPFPVQGHWPVGAHSQHGIGSFRMRSLKRPAASHRNSKATDWSIDWANSGGEPTGDHTDASTPGQWYIATTPPDGGATNKHFYVRDKGMTDCVSGVGVGTKKAVTNPGSFPLIYDPAVASQGTHSRLEITTNSGTTVLKRIQPDFEGQLLFIRAADANLQIRHLNTDNPELTNGNTNGQFRLPRAATYTCEQFERLAFLNNGNVWEPLNWAGLSLDADLQAIAALATTAFGRSLLTMADAAAALATLGAEAVATSAGRYRPLLNIAQTRFNSATITSASTWPLAVSANTGAFTGTNISFGLIYLNAADYAIGALTAKLRVVAGCLVNDTAPGITFTIGLYPVGAPSGAINVLNPNIGAVIAGSTVALTTPAANSAAAPGNSGDFNFPGTGWYLLAVATNGAMTTNSRVDISARLEVRNV